MNAQIYNIVATAVSAMWLNPLLLIVLVVVPVAIVTGLAGRLAMVYEDLRYTRISSRNG